LAARPTFWGIIEANVAAPLWRRMVAAGRAAVAAFNEKSLVPDERFGWDTRAARLLRYDVCDAYYNNVAYSQIVAFAAQLKVSAKLYKYIRGIYNPSERLVDAYPANIYGGSLDFENATKGAIPIIQADDTLRGSIKQLWIWSNWGNQKSLFVRQGAKLGDTALKVVDDREARKVRLEVLHPGKIKDVVFDGVGNVKRIVIEYQYEDEQPVGNSLVNTLTSAVLSRSHTYREEIDENKFKTFRDGEAFAFFKDAQGNPVSEWPNDYGFVPVVIAQHKDLGFMWGANAFHGQVPKINEINDAASVLNDQVRKAVNLIWYYSGVVKKGDLTVDTETRDGIPAVYGPKESQPFPMVAQLDIAAASANIQDMLLELERDLPELALHRLRESGNLTAPGVRAGYRDAIAKFVEAGGNYDDALIRAQMMGVSIGAFNRYKGFEAFDLNSYARGELTHYIAERSVIDESLTMEQRIQFLMQSGAPESAVWEAMNIPADTIAQWQKELANKQAAVEARFNAQVDAMAQGGITQGDPTQGGGNA
jgi:hypothetical protein